MNKKYILYSNPQEERDVDPVTFFYFEFEVTKRLILRLINDRE